MNQLALDLSNTPAARMTPPGRKAAPPRSRRSDPATSQRAAAKVDRFAGGHFAKILSALRCLEDANYREIASEAGLEPVAVARRMREIEQAGKIVRHGERDGFTVWRLA